jgi:phosphatidylglycerol phospholipase C
LRIQVDVKPHNDAERLFTLLHEVISAQEDWQTTLAPRVILGLWHPRFILAAVKIMPYLRRSYIGASISIARDYFWDSCQAFSIQFAALATTEGAKFR